MQATGFGQERIRVFRAPVPAQPSAQPEIGIRKRHVRSDARQFRPHEVRIQRMPSCPHPIANRLKIGDPGGGARCLVLGRQCARYRIHVAELIGRSSGLRRTHDVPGLIDPYTEQRADERGYTANPAGPAYVDPGVAGFLAEQNLLSHPSSVDARWRRLEPDSKGRFQVPTLRNIDKRPYPAFVKAYGHNGYFRSLEEIVHFYNTRDVLPRCQTNDPGEGVTC